uniref:Secreted protein n=1 Tax=Ixodes ricinus TaxID=34613 RepID=A0A6B0UTT2_IXORI
MARAVVQLLVKVALAGPAIAIAGDESVVRDLLLDVVLVVVVVIVVALVVLLQGVPAVGPAGAQGQGQQEDREQQTAPHDRKTTADRRGTRARPASAGGRVLPRGEHVSPPPGRPTHRRPGWPSRSPTPVARGWSRT